MRIPPSEPKDLGRLHDQPAQGMGMEGAENLPPPGTFELLDLIPYQEALQTAGQGRAIEQQGQAIGGWGFEMTEQDCGGHDDCR